MFGYRAFVFGRYLDCMNEGLALRQQVAEVAALPGEDRRERLPDLREQAATLRSRVEALRATLPDEVLDELISLPKHIGSDLSWLDDGLRRPNLSTAMGAVVDIVERRGPRVWQTFEAWCDRHTATDAELEQKIERLLNIGETDSAVRKAWAVFKSRVVRRFDLPTGIDGDRLAVAVFGAEGATAGGLPGPEREGYLQLVKGLYALHRNEIVHNDVAADVGATEAVLALLSGLLVRLDSLE